MFAPSALNVLHMLLSLPFICVRHGPTHLALLGTVPQATFAKKRMYYNMRIKAMAKRVQQAVKQAQAGCQVHRQWRTHAPMLNAAAWDERAPGQAAPPHDPVAELYCLYHRRCTRIAWTSCTAAWPMPAGRWRRSSMRQRRHPRRQRRACQAAPARALPLRSSGRRPRCMTACTSCSSCRRRRARSWRGGCLRRRASCRRPRDGSWWSSTQQVGGLGGGVERG
jgi:hypothetical protein